MGSDKKARQKLKLVDPILDYIPDSGSCLPLPHSWTRLLQMLAATSMKNGGRIQNIGVFPLKQQRTLNLYIFSIAVKQLTINLEPQIIHILLSHSVCKSEIQAWHSQGFHSKSYQAKINARAGWHSQLEFRVLTQAHSSCWKNSVPCSSGLRTFFLAGKRLALSS